MLSGAEALIAALRLEIEKLRRALYGTRSERKVRLLDQLELQLEELEAINRHHSYYHPPSDLHEPFASLFAKKPEAALALVRDLANHATNGWHQVQLLNRRRMGTPIPMLLTFPWGEQRFWVSVRADRYDFQCQGSSSSTLVIL